MKLTQGLTTLEEVSRVLPIQACVANRCPSCNYDVAPSFPFCPFCGIPNVARA